MNEEYPAIHRKAKAENAEIFWGDETAVQNVANYARGYAPKGKTPVVKVQAKKMHINMIGTQAMVQDIQELQDNTSAFMGRLSGEPDHVKAYFDHPALTKYKLD